MTAHAMKGDRELCLEKGMDDYVSKPIQAKQLKEAIERQLGNAAAPKPEVPSAGGPEGQEVFDKNMLLDRLEGDKELFKEIVGMFLGDAPLQMEKIKQSLQEGNSAQIESQAHGLKGAAMNIGGNGLQAVAFEMEVSGKNGDLDKARPLMDKLDEEFARLKKALMSLEL